VCLLSNEKAGFEKSGILQFNPNAIDTAKLLPSTLYKAPSFSSPSTLQSSKSSLCPPSPSVSLNTTMEDSVSTLSAVSPSPTISPPLLQFLPGALKMVVVVQDCLNSPEPPLHQLFPPGVNPLVAAGLVPVNLADILAPPSKDAAASKKRSKRITGAREQTANEYTSCLKEEERKKKKRLKKKKGKRSEHKTLMPSPLDSYALSK